MRAFLSIAFPLAAFFIIAGCNGIPKPSEVIARSPELVDRLEGFCAADFEEASAESLGVYVGVYNAVAPLVGRDTFDLDGMLASEVAAGLSVARVTLCLALLPEPKPAVVEAVEEADVVIVEPVDVVATEPLARP